MVIVPSVILIMLVEHKGDNMFKLKCSGCGKVWKGATEYEVEINADSEGCKCSEIAKGMSLEELRAKALASQERKA